MHDAGRDATSADRPNGRWDVERGEYLPSVSATALARPYARRHDRRNSLFLRLARIEGELEHAAFDRCASRFQRRWRMETV